MFFVEKLPTYGDLITDQKLTETGAPKRSSSQEMLKEVSQNCVEGSSGAQLRDQYLRVQKHRDQGPRAE